MIYIRVSTKRTQVVASTSARVRLLGRSPPTVVVVKQTVKFYESTTSSTTYIMSQPTDSTDNVLNASVSIHIKENIGEPSEGKLCRLACATLMEASALISCVKEKESDHHVDKECTDMHNSLLKYCLKQCDSS